MLSDYFCARKKAVAQSPSGQWEPSQSPSPLHTSRSGISNSSTETNWKQRCLHVEQELQRAMRLIDHSNQLLAHKSPLPILPEAPNELDYCRTPEEQEISNPEILHQWKIRFCNGFYQALLQRANRRLVKLTLLRIADQQTQALELLMQQLRRGTACLTSRCVGRWHQHVQVLL